MVITFGKDNGRFTVTCNPNQVTKCSFDGCFNACTDALRGGVYSTMIDMGIIEVVGSIPPIGSEVICLRRKLPVEVVKGKTYGRKR